jgi:hypothetical protein
MGKKKVEYIPNPLCACGCKQEVRIPTNKYIIGHSTKMLFPHPPDWHKLAIRMWKLGWQYKEIAEHFGVSKGRVSQVIGDYNFMENRSPEIIELHRINDEEKKKRSEVIRRRVKED